MAEVLAPRQIQILKALVEEYTETAEPVGSETLEKKYNLGVSPATIRNEMAALTHTGYLKQPHTSAGRIPTPRALKFYVDQLMEEKKMSVAEEVQAKERISQGRDLDSLMSEATRALAEATHSLSVGAIEGEEHAWHAGYANILEMPEFYNIDVTAHVLSLLEEVKRLHELLFERLPGGEPIGIVFGEELGWPYFEPVSVVATRFKTKNKQGSLGVIGPNRLRFSVVIPTVRYFGDLVSRITKSW